MNKTEIVLKMSSFALFAVFTTTASLGQENLARVGLKAPAWEVEKFFNSKDATTNIDELNGSVIILDFWGTWCGPCIASFAHVNELINHYEGKEIQFITVGYEDTEKAKKILVRKKVKAWMAVDTDLSVFSDYDAWTIPLVYIIDKSGIVVAKIHPNDLNEEMINSVLNGEKVHVQNGPDSPYPDPEGAKRHFLNAIRP